MIRLKMVEEAKVWNEYTIELTDEYVKNFNDYLQKEFKPINAEKIPYLDAELLAAIYESEGIQEVRDCDGTDFPIELKDIGRESFQDIKMEYREFEYYENKPYFSLLEVVDDMLREDVCDVDYEVIDFQMLDYSREVEKN